MTVRALCSPVFTLVVGLSLLSCADLFGPDEREKIPYGYDPDFNYLAVLKSSPRYAYEATGDMPVFTYQAAEDTNLTVLRTAYALDEVAGDGDELSRIFNLLRWVNLQLDYDGGRRVEPENALSILADAEESGNGVNCVMMAIVLSEACLALGIPSRVIHGNPRDWVFNGEWHAFNAVYSQTLDKWIFLDSMMQAWFADDEGTPLSPAEIRDRLRRDLPVELNEDAECNGVPADPEAYLHYLTKNLYRFSTSLHSAYGKNWFFHPPGDATRYYVHLDPRNDQQDGLTIGTNYFTSNPDYYWIRP